LPCGVVVIFTFACFGNIFAKDKAYPLFEIGFVSGLNGLSNSVHFC